MGWEIAIPIVATLVAAITVAMLTVMARRSQEEMVKDISKTLQKEVEQVKDTIEHELDRGR